MWKNNFYFLSKPMKPTEKPGLYGTSFVKESNLFPTGDFPLGVVWQTPQKDMYLHSHNFHELVIVFQGHAKHCYEGRAYSISGGDIFFIKPGMMHAYERTSEMQLVNILYYPERLGIPSHDLLEIPGYHAFFELEPAMREQHGFEGKLKIHGRELEYLKGLSIDLTNEIAQRKRGRLFACYSILTQIILRVSRLYEEDSDNSAQKNLFQLGSVLGEIQRNFKKPLNINGLSEKAAMSPSSFYRSFRKTMGVSPIEYILSLRLTHARNLLESSDKNISEIAEESGFQDSNYFTRMFRKKFGISPRAFRKLYTPGGASE